MLPLMAVMTLSSGVSWLSMVESSAVTSAVSAFLISCGSRSRREVSYRAVVSFISLASAICSVRYWSGLLEMMRKLSNQNFDSALCGLLPLLLALMVTNCAFPRKKGAVILLQALTVMASLERAISLPALSITVI